MSRERAWYWVLRDLSNGDGADGRPLPTYLWAHPTREGARAQRREHVRLMPRLSRLGPVEYWPAENLTRHYAACIEPSRNGGGYYVRRSR